MLLGKVRHSRDDRVLQRLWVGFRGSKRYSILCPIQILRI